MKSRLEEDSLLLAYYLGNLQVLNVVALQSITSDIIDNFLAPPFNNTTKYSGHTEGCCICHEREKLYKRVLKQYYQSSNTSNSTPPATFPDIDECWKEVEKLWQDHGIGMCDGDGTLDECATGSFQVDCFHLLAQHKVFLNKAGSQKCEKRWQTLLASVKRELKSCIESVQRINKGDLDITPLATQCPNFTMKKLTNCYLTLMIAKGARAQAKHLQQSCRKIGIQIRASREPIAVVSKYMICGECLEKPTRRQIVNVTHILEHSLTIFPTDIPYNNPPDRGEKLRCEKAKRKLLASAKRLPSVEVKFHSSNLLATATNTNVNCGAISKCESIYIFKNSPTKVLSPTTANPLKRKLVTSLGKAKKFRLQSGSGDKESLNVVIVGDSNQTATNAAALKPTDPSTPKLSKSLQPINIKTQKILKSPQPINIQRQKISVSPQPINMKTKKISVSPHPINIKTQKMSISPQPISIKPIKVINTQVKSPNGSTKILCTGSPLRVQKKLPLANFTQQSDNFPVVKLNARSVFQRSLTPINVMGMSKIPRRPGDNPPKKPFVVQIIDNRLTDSATCVKEYKPTRPVPVIKTIPFSSNNGIKFVKAVSIPNQPSKTTPGTILVKSLKLTNSVIAPTSGATVLARNGLHAMQRVNIIPPKFKSHAANGLLRANGQISVASNPLTKFQPFSPSLSVVNMATFVAHSQYDVSKKPAAAQLKTTNRTPSKKRSRTNFPSKPVSTVVAEYLLSLTPSADKDLWRKLKTRRKRRWEKTSSLIPVPYETHFLCIDNTIKKLGWKAYWYRKCRCSKIREKAAGADDGDDRSKGHSVEDMKKWIPAAITDKMREELSNAFEREDKCTSPTTNGCSTSRDVVAADGNVSTPKKINIDTPHIDLSRVKLEFIPPVVQPQSSSALPTEPPETVSKQANTITPPVTNDKFPPITLKAKYCRGENGLWKSMSKGADRSPQKELHRFAQQSANSVNLNLGGAFAQEPKDPVESSTVDGLRRCPRATMLRRKSLVDRAERFERNTKAKRQRTESHATENFMFSSTCNSSSAREQRFSVVSPHPVLFKESDDLQALFQVIKNGKSTVKLSVCKRQTDAACEKQRQKKYYENIISSIMQNVTANADTRENKPGQKKSDDSTMKNQKCELLNELKIAWDKSDIDYSGNVVDTSAFGSSKQTLKRPIRKRIMHIKPELMYNCLQMLRGIPSSEPLTNIISEENAKFITSALKITGSTSKLLPCDIPEEKTNHCSNVKRTDCQQNMTLTAETDRVPAVSTVSDATTQKLCNDKVENDVFPSTSVIPMLMPHPTENSTKLVKKKPVTDCNFTVPSTGAIFYRLSNPLPERSSPRRHKELPDEWFSFDAFQGKLNRYLKSWQTLSCLLGSRSVLRLEDELSEWDEHYIDDPKMEVRESANRPTVQVNKRKRPPALNRGVQGLEIANGDMEAVTTFKTKGDCNGLEFSYERPLTCLLSKDLDVTSLKRSLWESTSARSMGLHRKYYTTTVLETPKKVSLHRSSVDNAPKVKEAKLTAKPPVIARSTSEPEATSPPFLRPSLMLIKHSPRKNSIRTRPQGISRARMVRPFRQPQAIKHQNGVLNNVRTQQHDFSPPRKVSGDDLLRILQPCKVRTSERFKKVGIVTPPNVGCTNVQMLRETVFAELQSRKRKRCEEDVNEGETSSSERKLNRFSTNGNFISRLLQFDSETFAFENS